MVDLARYLPQLMPSVQAVIDSSRVSGGCISDARCVSVRDSSGQTQRLLVKTNAADFADNFQAEFAGLQRLQAAAAIGVVRPLAVGTAGGAAWLVTQWIETQPAGGDFYQRFGRALADLHRVTLGDRIGLDHDNFLGSAPQINTPTDSWCEFVSQHRIGPQLRRAVDDRRADRGLHQDLQRVLATMDQSLAGRADETSLLHGDLWSGNYLCDPDGQAMLIDPAVYHGCREAEFGMLRLFGGCPAAFYDAYQDAFPLADGWQRRVNVYVLYHLLNHLNLFGSGYLGQCKSVAAELLRS